MLRFSKGLISIILLCTIILLGFINTSSADIEIESVEVFPFVHTEYILVNNGLVTKPPNKGDARLAKNYEPGKGDSWTPYSWLINYPLGRLIDHDETFYFEAYPHLQVQTVDAGIQVQDDWEADTGIQTFTKKDNP